MVSTKFVAANRKTGRPEHVFVQEVGVPATRQEAKGWGSFAAPLLAIVGLLAAYVLLGEWPDLPHLFDTAFAAVSWTIPG